MFKEALSFILLLVVVYIAGYITTGIVYSKVMASIEFKPEAVWYPGDLTVKLVPRDTLQTEQYTPIQPSVTPIGEGLNR